MIGAPPRRFAFLVHPLLPWQRPILGVRRLHLPLLMAGEAGIDAVGPIARLRIGTPRGDAEGVIVAVPDLAERLAADQRRALALQRRAAHQALAAGAEVIGLGSALAVVAGRGTALAQSIGCPVTTGNAATAWACTEITRTVLADRRETGPVGVLGFKGTVGDAVAAALAAAGHTVIVEAGGAAVARRAEAVGCTASPRDELLQRCRVLVGAATTGPTLDPSEMPDDRVLVDLSLPPTLAAGPRPRGLVRVPGEPLTLPGPLHAGFWGRIWLWMAGYGRGCVYACFAETVAACLTGGTWSEGRRLDPERLASVGAALTELGFRPVARPRR